MKKQVILSILILATSAIISFAQEKKNALRAGVGLSFDKAELFYDDDVSANSGIGVALFAEYSRVINPWFSVSGGLSTMSTHLSKKVIACRDPYYLVDAPQSLNSFAVNVQGLFRPFHKTSILDRLELGGGVTLDYLRIRETNMGGMMGLIVTNGNVQAMTEPSFNITKDSKLAPGVFLTGRIRIIDNDSIDLSLTYTYKLLKYKTVRDVTYKAYYYDYYGVLFGVKF